MTATDPATDSSEKSREHRPRGAAVSESPTIATLPDERVSVPEVVGVLGGGRMGVGIAHAFLLAGSRAIILERDDTAAAHARDGLATAINRSVTRVTTSETAQTLLERTEVTTDITAFAGARLVIEAVPEDFALKSSMLQRTEAVLGNDAWLTSNTSSLSIDDLAANPPGCLVVWGGERCFSAGADVSEFA